MRTEVNFTKCSKLMSRLILKKVLFRLLLLLHRRRNIPHDLHLLPVNVSLYTAQKTFHYITDSTVTKPDIIYLLKVNDKNTTTRCEISSKLTIKRPERLQWRRSDVFIVNFEHISHLVLVFLLLTLNMQLRAENHRS